MSKRKKKTSAKKRKAGSVTKLPVRSTPSSKQITSKKLSEIIMEMVEQLLRMPDGEASEPAWVAALTLASAAWNSSIGDHAMRERHRKRVDQIDWDDVTPWAELRTDDTEQLIAELVEYKQEHYPDDLRRIMATEMTLDGNVRVHWAEPDNVVPAAFGTAPEKTRTTSAKRGHPIADKLIKQMNRHARAKVVDLQTTVIGRKNAEEHYLPSGPPMSPLTPSFFTCWAFFDACVAGLR